MDRDHCSEQVFTLYRNRRIRVRFESRDHGVRLTITSDSDSKTEYANAGHVQYGDTFKPFFLLPGKTVYVVVDPRTWNVECFHGVTYLITRRYFSE